MIQLNNNCRISALSVFPGNWDSPKADANCKWYISYRFYDDNLKANKKIIIKGMNKYSALKEKQAAVITLKNDEMEILASGFNPVTGYVPPPPKDAPIDEKTPLNKALQYAFDNKPMADNTKVDLRSILNYFKPAANRLGYGNIPVKDITRRHVKFILDEAGKAKGDKWTNNNYNHYRRNISMLFADLRELEVIEYNPVTELSKRKSTKRIRKTLTKEERMMVSKFLFKKHYTFWRFMQIFFHSGSRESELMLVKKEDVDFNNYRFLITQKKGTEYREVWRTMKKIASPFWKEVYEMAAPGQYLFCEGLIPGGRPISPKQITKRWYRLVKKKTDWNKEQVITITADFYSLKHSNLDEISEIMGSRIASKAAGHASEEITKAHYLVNEDLRIHNDIKNMENSFA